MSAASDGRNQGATLTVDLPTPLDAPRHPTRPSQRGPARPWHPPGEVPSLAGTHVLVVDDDEDTLEAVRHLLEQAGARVTAVGSAGAAFQAIEGEPPDVLLSDIGMPGEDGISLIRRVRALAPERGGKVPAAAITAYTQPADRERVLSAGYQAFLAKPVDPRELAAAVARLAGLLGSSTG